MKSIVVVGILLSLVLHQIQSAEKNVDEFVATNEWQVVKEGQHLPAGLHVRLNLETGLREAKLLEADESSSNSNSIVAVPSEITQEEISRRNLEEAFAQLDLTRDDVPSDQTHEDEVRRKFRPYEELQKDFQTLNMKIQTDQEILTNLIKEFKEKKNIDELKKILIDFEYFLHQYDNAIVFADLDGLFLLMNSLNATDTDLELRHSICLALAAAFQGNPKVQLKGLHLGFIESLLRLIRIESNDEFKARLVYPLSTLLRNFPQAQIQFLQYGGAELMTNLIDSNRKLANRAVTLMNDLIVEKKFADSNKRPAYENVQIDRELVERGWCDRLSTRLKSVDVDEFETVEKILDAFVQLKENCSQQVQSLHQTFSRINEVFKKLHQDDQSIYGDLLHNIDILLQHRSNDEL